MHHETFEATLQNNDSRKYVKFELKILYKLNFYQKTSAVYFITLLVVKTQNLIKTFRYTILLLA